MSRRASVRAPAKVNLALRVLGRRPDGYHELDTLFQAIDLCDEVEVAVHQPRGDREAAGDAGPRLSLEVEGADLGPEEANLAYRAADRFLTEGGHPDRVRIRLLKRIPAGSGLGGGSSDAAAVLRCLAALLGGPPPERLAELGAGLGSDVPFFLGSSALARGTGRGEVLEPLPPLPPGHLVVVSPPVHVSTAEAYADLARLRAKEPERAAVGPTPAARTWEEMATGARNDFEPVIRAKHPEVGRALEALEGEGAVMARMSGSGSSCFGLFPDADAAGRAAAVLAKGLGWGCVAGRTLQALSEVRVETAEHDG